MKKFWFLIVGFLLALIIGFIAYPIYKKFHQLGKRFTEEVVKNQEEFSNSIFRASCDKDNIHFNISIVSSDTLLMSAFDNNTTGKLGSERAYKKYKINDGTIKILDDISEFERFNISSKLVKHKNTDYMFCKIKKDSSLDSNVLMKINYNSIDF